MLLTPFNAIAARTGKASSRGRRLPGEDEEDEEEDEEGCNAFHTHPRLPPPLRNPTLPGEQLPALQHHRERNTEGLERKCWSPPAPGGGGSGTEMLQSGTQCVWQCHLCEGDTVPGPTMRSMKLREPAFNTEDVLQLLERRL